MIRTLEDVQQRRFGARVFEISVEGALINAGEYDGLSKGETAELVRDGRVLGQVEIQRVQREYSVIRAVRAAPGEVAKPGTSPPGVPPDEPPALLLGDVVRFRPPPQRPIVAGTISGVTDETLFTVRLAAGAAPAGAAVADLRAGIAPLQTPLAIRASGRTIGVGVLLMSRDLNACGFALDCSLESPAKVGDELVMDAPEPARPPEAVGQTAPSGPNPQKP